jgi:hypothetical protein
VHDLAQGASKVFSFGRWFDYCKAPEDLYLELQQSCVHRAMMELSDQHTYFSFS